MRRVSLTSLLLLLILHAQRLVREVMHIDGVAWPAACGAVEHMSRDFTGETRVLVGQQYTRIQVKQNIHTET